MTRAQISGTLTTAQQDGRCNSCCCPPPCEVASISIRNWTFRLCPGCMGEMQKVLTELRSAAAAAGGAMTSKPRPLGEVQRDVLCSLKEHKKWSPRGGWLWDTWSNTRRIMDGLVKRGLVEKKVLHLKSQLRPSQPGFDEECYVLTRAGVRAANEAQQARRAEQQARRLP